MITKTIGLSILSLVVACALACGSGGEEQESDACDAMCKHLIEVLGGCGKDDASSHDVCVSECEEHLMEGDCDESEVMCGANALSCATWHACGDLL